MTTKQFYQHLETGNLYAIERSWDGHIVGSAGPLDEPLQEPEDYEYTADLNDWLESQNDKLLLYQ